MRRAILIGLAAAALAVPAARAHHSFAVFFDPSKTIAVTGKVTAFQFANPHGTIRLDAAGKSGEVEHWAVETNAPVVLLRRGWTRTSLKPGDTVTIEGWPARDGKRYLRLLKATRADGTTIGGLFGKNDD